MFDSHYNGLLVHRTVASFRVGSNSGGMF